VKPSRAASDTFYSYLDDGRWQGTVYHVNLKGEYLGGVKMYFKMYVRVNIGYRYVNVVGLCD
jgi:hypothetical protein